VRQITNHLSLITDGDTITIMKNTIKKHSDFTFPDDAPTYRCDLFMVKSRPARVPDHGEYGLIVSKKKFRRATQRNRAKRLIRAWIFAGSNKLPPNLDFLFIARDKILESDFATGQGHIKSAIAKLSA